MEAPASDKLRVVIRSSALCWRVENMERDSSINSLDRHVETGRADQAALIYDSPVTDTIRTFTYRELRDEVAAFAGALASYGVTKGERVLIYMPMVPEAVIAMLACARLGAVHSVVFGSRRCSWQANGWIRTRLNGPKATLAFR